jgi:hypothetical protein
LTRLAKVARYGSLAFNAAIGAALLALALLSPARAAWQHDKGGYSGATGGRYHSDSGGSRGGWHHGRD